MAPHEEDCALIRLETGEHGRWRTRGHWDRMDDVDVASPPMGKMEPFATASSAFERRSQPLTPTLMNHLHYLDGGTDERRSQPLTPSKEMQHCTTLMEAPMSVVRIR